MSDIPFLDTNILLYSFTADGRSARAQMLMSEPFVTGVQALNEFAAVARRKMRMQWFEIRLALGDIRLLATKIVPIGLDTHSSALDLADRYDFSFYDALIVGAALEAGCNRLYSEDMHNDLIVGNQLTITNPFR